MRQEETTFASLCRPSLFMLPMDLWSGARTSAKGTAEQGKTTLLKMVDEKILWADSAFALVSQHKAKA